MAKSWLLVVVGVLVFGSTPFETHARSQDNVANQLVGMWRLVSWTQRLADGTTRQYPSVSYIIYTDTGHMCYVLMNPNRPKWKSGTAPTPDEAVSGMGSNTEFGAYCSSVEVHAKEGFVLHHVEIERVPNNVGTTRKRWFAFEGRNRMSLRIDPPELPSGVVENTLMWERVQK
jgi:hypothetical protein